MTTELAQTKQKILTPIDQIKKYVAEPDTKRRLAEMLGQESGIFSNSIINLVSNSTALAKCEPGSVMRAAMKAASVKLPIDKALGFAAIVPYGNQAEFQLMYKGVIQLCQRSGQYKTIWDTEVYKDELDWYNPITGAIQFRDLVDYKMRPGKKPEDVAGFFCRFELLNGFQASLFLTREETLAHARRYSKAYQQDLSRSRKDSPWSTNEIAMGRKNVILRLMTRYGIMSIEMRTAYLAERGDDGPHRVESTTVEPTDGRQPFGFVAETDTQPPAGEADDGAAPQEEQQEPLADEKPGRKCFVCKQPRTNMTRQDFEDGTKHLICQECNRAGSSTGMGQADATATEAAGVTDGTEAEPVPEFDDETMVECANGHKFPYKLTTKGELGRQCAQCGDISFKAVPPPDTKGLPGTLTCPVGHVVAREKILPTILAKGPGALGKCPVCDANGSDPKIIWEPK